MLYWNAGVPGKDVYRIMDEKERQQQAVLLEQEETKVTAQDEAAEEEETEEEQQTLYFGRFTSGVWHGGVLGLALDFILMAWALFSLLFFNTKKAVVLIERQRL